MKSILVTGVGGGVGQSILKSLQGGPYRVIAADGEPLAAGLYCADKGYLIPYAAKPGFIERLIEISQAEGCQILFPGLDAELPVLAAARDRFKQAGITAVVSDPNVVEICDDKLLTAQFLEKHGFPSPATVPLSQADGFSAFPAVLKPRKGGARSHGVFVVKDAKELEQRAKSLNVANYVVQQQIQGDEFTCGSVNFEGTCYGAIVMRRILRDGDTYKAFVVKDKTITDFVIAAAQALKPFGGCNFQLRMQDGKPHVFEFNARCSGTTYCRTLAGFNEPLMIANYLMQGTIPSYNIREISILRYWKELVVENDRIVQMQSDGTVGGNGSRL